MELVIWILLVAIAVSDAREFKIPNKWLLIVLCVSLFFKLLEPEPLTSLAFSFLAGLLFFTGGLALFFAGAMAPGDVKLLGVIGFWLGWGELVSATQWIAVATIVVGAFYALMQLAMTGGQVRPAVSYYATYLVSRKSIRRNASDASLNSEKLVMPFAPVVVIGLALHSYF